MSKPTFAEIFAVIRKRYPDAATDEASHVAAFAFANDLARFDGYGTVRLNDDEIGKAMRGRDASPVVGPHASDREKVRAALELADRAERAGRIAATAAAPLPTASGDSQAPTATTVAAGATPRDVRRAEADAMRANLTDIRKKAGFR